MSQEVTLRPRGAQRLRGPSGKEKPGLPAPSLPAGGGHLRLAQGKREESTRSRATPVTLTLIRVPRAATSPCGKLSLHLQEPPPRATRARPGLSALRLCGPCRGGRATGAPGSPSGWASGACPPSGCARNRTGGTGAGLRPSAGSGAQHHGCPPPGPGPPCVRLIRPPCPQSAGEYSLPSPLCLGTQPGTPRSPGVPRTEARCGHPTTASFNKGRDRGSVRTPLPRRHASRECE